MADVKVMIDIHRHFAASRPRVYQAFTDEVELAAWFGPLAGWVVPGTITVDVRAGGHRRLTMATYSSSMSWTIDTTYTDVVPDRRLVGHETVTGFPALEGAEPFWVRQEFFDENDGTRLELHIGPCPRAAENTCREFWMQAFTKLDTFLAEQS